MRTLTSRLARAGLEFSLCVALVIALRANAVELVRDINDGQSGTAIGSGHQTADFPNGTMMALEDEAHGSELWFTDYTPQGTRLVRDIFPGRASGGPGWFVKLGNAAVFMARDETHGFELWRSDGTSSGTYMLADIGPGAQSYGGGYPTKVLNGILYFTADDGVTGNELWRTDGTREGTHLVADIVPGYEGSYPQGLAVSASHLFFKREREVWVSDGTAPGTRKVADLVNVGEFWAVGNAVFFGANDEVHGVELWRADADGQNVQMVANLNTQPVGGGQDGSSMPGFVFARGSSFFFVGQVPLSQPNNGTANDCVLFRAETSGPGVTEIMNFHARCGISKVINLPAGVLFSLYRSGAGDANELWVSDGTPSGTQPLDLDNVYYSTTNDDGHFKAAYGNNGEAYFFGRQPGNDVRDKIWRTDGTRAGTRVFAEPPGFSQQQEIVFFNGRLYFDTGAGDPTGDELWTSDGTSAGTFLVKDVVPGIFGATMTNLRVANGRLHFFAGYDASNLRPWVSDGTNAGTLNISRPSDASSGTTGNSSVAFVGQLGSRVLMTADGGPAAEGRELYLSDGTRIGTAVVRDINTGGSSDPANFLKLGNQWLFVAREWGHGRELWRTDGTEAGTTQLTNIGSSGDDGHVTLGDAGTIINGVAYFTAGSASSPELWRTDGTAAGTSRVPGTYGLRIDILGGNGTSLLFTSYHPLAPVGVHLHSFDGNAAQILAVADSLKIASGPGVTFDGRVCFRAWDVNPQALDVWCTNGTAGDLLRATNFSALGSSAGDMRVFGNKLLVNALGSGASSGLYVTAGMASGMQKISSERIVSAKEWVGSKLVFTTESGGLRVTDGTNAGTRDLLQGVTLPGSVPGAFGVLGNYIVFMVNDPQRGALVWRTDGTPSGTRYLADLDSGSEPASLDSNSFYTFGNRLLFSAYMTGIGNELWSINATDPNASNEAIAATGGVAVSVDVLQNDADFDGTLNAATVTIVTQPLHGVASVNAATGAITYTATTSYSGTDELTYRVSDDQGNASNAGKLTIQVTAGAVPPPTTPPATPQSSGGGALGLELLWLLILAGGRAGFLRRQRKLVIN